MTGSTHKPPVSPEADPAPSSAERAEHTKGPWEIGSVGKRGYRVPINAAGWSAFAKVVVRMAGADKDFPEGRANARLISSAPDFMSAVGGDLEPQEHRDCGPLSWLLEALNTLNEPAVKEVALTLVGPNPDPDAYDEMVIEVGHLYDKLSAAIAKATGEK